jgi:polyphosphate:AMP phosphotransferase
LDAGEKAAATGAGVTCRRSLRYRDARAAAAPGWRDRQRKGLPCAMFEAADAGRSVSKEDYASEVARLRWDLLDLQRSLRTSQVPLIVVVGGPDGAGKSELLQLFNQWLDPRGIVNRAFDEPSPDERDRPPFWRYWQALPARGRIGLFMGGWYGGPMAERVARRTTRAAFDATLDRIAAFEQVLADDGAILLKFWLHLARRAQKRRLRALEQDPRTRWRITATQWAQYEHYDRWITVAEHAIRRTSRGHAPWAIVDSADERYRNLAVGRAIRDALYQRLGTAIVPDAPPAPGPPARPRPAGGAGARVHGERSVLDAVDMTRTLSATAFPDALAAQQRRLNRLQRKAARRGRSVILLFEGWDAAGKGGAIRRLLAALPPQAYDVVPIAAPSDEEQAHHYLWRFWRHVSRAGRVTVFDRSWYGRVLVERVEGLARPEEWRRAYAEIGQFEDELTAHGIVLVKYWLHITRDEQERRFRERAASPYKSWKLTDEDWRNRDRWRDYELAVDEMVGRTSTRHAPWHLVPANDKAFARVEVVRIAADAIARAL